MSNQPPGRSQRSGVFQVEQAARSSQPDASGRVLCPFCKKLYPFSQVLLNRQLRCSGCRGVFTVAEDRHSFGVTPPPEPVPEPVPAPGPVPGPGPVPEPVGTASHQTRQAIQVASTQLSSLASEALKAIAAREHPTVEPGSGSDPGIQNPTAKSDRKPSTPAAAVILTGSGEAMHRQTMQFVAIVAGVVVLGILIGIWSLAKDGRRTALLAFQGASAVGQDFTGRLTDMRRRGLGGTAIGPIINLEQAAFGPESAVEVEPMNTHLHGMRVLIRGILWVEAARLDEAKALIGDAVTVSAKGLGAALERLTKAGIRYQTWEAMIKTIESGLPDQAKGLARVWLSPVATRQARCDPVTLLDAGAFPTRIRLVEFSGQGNELLAFGPSKAVSYRGRLAQVRGDGWPADWMVLDLIAEPPAGP